MDSTDFITKKKSEKIIYIRSNYNFIYNLPQKIKLLAYFYINQCYKIDIERVSKKYFGTNDINHPGVKKFKEKGSFIIRSQLEKISQIKYHSSVLSPSNTRMIFTMKG